MRNVCLKRFVKQVAKRSNTSQPVSGRRAAQVVSALQKSDALLVSADHEVYAGRVFGRPFYLPRPFAALLSREGSVRRFPHERVRKVGSAVRSVARVQMSLLSLVQDSFSDEVVVVIRERFPLGLLAQVIRSSAEAIEVRAQALVAFLLCNGRSALPALFAARCSCYRVRRLHALRSACIAVPRASSLQPALPSG
jgi:hypothetical protein